VAVNCGALTASLLETELFGHRRGAFSGATEDRPGFVRTAHRGTLFLDEIAELSSAGQIALLRVLQEREVIPVGDSRAISVDIRVCAANQRPLQLEVDAGKFRSDLYGRLLGHEIHLPPLRSRVSDLGILIGRLAARHGAANIQLHAAAAFAVLSYPWPRNIRELERCLSTAIALAEGRPIQLHHLPEPVQRAPIGRVQRLAARPAVPTTLRADPEDELRALLATKLVEHHGNISAVARALGKHREQIHRWLRRFGFDPEAFRR
jgi:transcriptional regulator with GAF, ATPase, and Fis domain